MPLGMEVGLGRGHIVLDGDQLPPRKKGTAASNFWPMSVNNKSSAGAEMGNRLATIDMG